MKATLANDRTGRSSRKSITPLARAAFRRGIVLLALAAGILAAPALAAREDDGRRAPGPVVTPLAYREGFARGEADARSGLSRSPGRWNDTVAPSDRQQFLLGYNDGYERLSPAPPQAPQASRFYQDGLAQGARDARNGTPKDPSRYHAPIPREKRADFTRGYVEAYDRELAAAGPRFYQQGMAQGARDARKGVVKDPSRHHAPIPREKRADFTRGYVDAYDLQVKVRPPAPQLPRTYEILGARYAQLDQQAGLRQDDSRHVAEVPSMFRAVFQRAYRAAWRPQPR